jgi:hypothetical protein
MKAITGNTFPVKDKLKALGGKWDADNKVWKVPDDKEQEAKAIVAAGLPPGAAQPAKSTYRPSRCKTCGCAPTRYNPIYRSGNCKDCWLSEKEEREMGY